MTNKDKAQILRTAAERLERLGKFVQQKSEPACQVRREAFKFLVDHLELLNEAESKHGIHGPLEGPLKQLGYLANKSQTKDLGIHITLDRDITQPKLSNGEEISFIEQLNLWADRYIETEQLIPDDLIPLAIVVQDYCISRSQIKRDIKNKDLKSYRLKPHSKHLVSRADADNLYLTKKGH